MGGCVSKKRGTPGVTPHAPAVKKGRGRKKKGTVAFQLQNGVALPGGGGENDVSIRRVQSEAAVNTSQVTPEVDDQSSVDAASMYGTPAGTPRSRMARLLSESTLQVFCRAFHLGFVQGSGLRTGWSERQPFQVPRASA